MKLTNLFYGSAIILLLAGIMAVGMYSEYALCVVNREHSPTSYRADTERIKEQCGELHIPFFLPRP